MSFNRPPRRWLVHGGVKMRRLALQADGVKEQAADAILRALGDKPVPLRNLARFKQLCAERRRKNWSNRAW